MVRESSRLDVELGGGVGKRGHGRHPELSPQRARQKVSALSEDKLRAFACSQMCSS
jgi:hypothetical protein